jgi:hypothetical protein
VVPGGRPRRPPDDTLSFLLFPVERPEFFDAVVLDGAGRVQEIQVKRADAASPGSGAPSRCRAACSPTCAGSGCSATARTSISARWSTRISRPAARPSGIKAGQSYVDVGTLHGYRAAIALLGDASERDSASGRVSLGWPAGRPLGGLLS